MTREVRTAADVEPFRAQIEEAAEDEYHSHGHRAVDWDDYLNDLEEYLEIDLGDDMLTPAIEKIKRITRKVIRELREG